MQIDDPVGRRGWHQLTGTPGLKASGVHLCRQLIHGKYPQKPELAVINSHNRATVKAFEDQRYTP